MSTLAYRIHRLAQRGTSFTNFATRAPWPRSTVHSPAQRNAETLLRVLSQLALGLAVLRNAIEHVPDESATESSAAVLQRWLPPTARQIEAAMQGLRTLPIATTQAVIELAQALTVVVLAADMLIQDQHPTDPEISALLCHNADRAWHYLHAIDPQMVAHR